MSAIMCSQRMSRVVRRWSGLFEPAAPGVGARILGPWAATIFKEDGPELVVAIEANTYLTIVFPFREPGSFHAALATALEAILHDLGVPEELAAIEVDAVRDIQMKRLVDANLREVLSTAEFICGIELPYHNDLARVQRNLNDFPHGLPPDYVPVEAARRAFGLSATSRVSGDR